jgi:hypothetical protein
MVPTITQQLRSMRRRFAETLLPAIPEAEEFAREQAQLMLATLDWLLDTHEHEYRYEVVENTEYRSLLTALLTLDNTDLDPDLLAEAHDELAEGGPAASEAATPLPELADQTRRLKALVERHCTALLDSADARNAASLLARTARSQGRRELAYYRATGFPQEPDELRAVLGTDHT